MFGLSQQSCGSHRNSNLAKYPIFPTSLLRLKLSWGRDNNLMIHTVIEILRKKRPSVTSKPYNNSEIFEKIRIPPWFSKFPNGFFLAIFWNFPSLSWEGILVIYVDPRGHADWAILGLIKGEFKCFISILF